VPRDEAIESTRQPAQRGRQVPELVEFAAARRDPQLRQPIIGFTQQPAKTRPQPIGITIRRLHTVEG
jgi:hypothetical protein